MQHFCGYKEYDDSKPPFDASLMVYVRKRLTPEILGEINERIINRREAKQEAPKARDDEHDNDNDRSGNGRTLIVG